MDIRTPYIRTPYIGTPSIKAQSVGASLVTGATKDVIATPVIALTGNSVTITCDTTGATIYYTLDGSTPTSSSSQYSSAFSLDSSCTIKAIAIKGGKSSGIAEEEYVKPITYLTQWKLVGNSEVHGTEIWSCGEYSAVDNKWHIRILPEGYGVVDIALDEPLRKVNDVADTIEFADGVVTLTRKIGRTTLDAFRWNFILTNERWNCYTTDIKPASTWRDVANILCTIYNTISDKNSSEGITGICMLAAERMMIKDSNYTDPSDQTDFEAHITNVELIYEKITPITETIQVPQIAEADSYTCEISQGAKAVSWSSFETE